MTGKTISHYKILEKLGEGGMGIVYKAEDLKLERFVALKFLPPHMSQADEEKQRFIHEAKAASALEHNNICNIHEIDETEDGQLFIAMALYEGESLKEKIERGPMPLDEAIEIAVQIAQGLAKAHAKGIVHRDIKPANVMITNENVVKVLDFGLAKLMGRTQLTKEGTTLGTMAYMSPEQAQGGKVARRTDIWSLGAVLYEMVTGRQPFQGDYEQAIMYAIMHEEPEPITGLRTGVPMELERIVNKALAKNPQERYQHVDELLVDLRSVGRELEAEQPKTAQIPTRLPRRRRVLLYGGIALLLILLALVGRGLFTSGHETIDSIAVLPLKNYSGDPEQEYFSDGMTEELIDKLGRIKSLRVISSTSAMRYKGTKKSLPEIARELDVAAIVEGSVQSFGEQVRIRVRLIDARADQQLWNSSFERELRNVLALQREVALAIAREVAVTLTPQEETRLAAAPEVNPEAYHLYLKGLQARAKDPWDYQPTIAFFGQAIAIDSSFAPAYAGLAIDYALEHLGDRPGSEVKARQLAEKALSLDPSLSESYIAIGLLRELVDWDWAGAAEAFRRAIELNPGDAFAHMELGQLWLRLGRLEEALAMAKQALYLDPLSARYQTSVGTVYLYSGRYHEAIAELKKALELGSSNIGYLVVAYWQTSMYEEACRLLDGSEVSILARPYAVICQRENALEVLADWKARWAQGDAELDILWCIAWIHADLGEKGQALDWLERAYEARSGILVYVKVDPGFYSLHEEPRFQALLEKMGLDQ